MVSKNARWRDLTPSVRATIVLAIEKAEAKLAKERWGGDRRSDDFQVGTNTHLKSGDKAKKAERSRPREKAAKAVGASPRYVQDAMK